MGIIYWYCRSKLVGTDEFAEQIQEVFQNSDRKRYDRTRRSSEDAARQWNLDVQVTHTPGQLTDHYNPANKTVNLSEGVYESNSIMAAAVAAHECGHAVQHARMMLR